MTMLDKLYERYMTDEMGGCVESEQEKEADKKLSQILKRVLPTDVSCQDSNDLDDAVVDVIVAAKKFGFEEGFKLAMGLAMECKGMENQNEDH